MTLATSGGFQYEDEILSIVDLEIEYNEKALTSFFQLLNVHEDPLKLNVDFETREVWVEAEDGNDESSDKHDPYAASESPELNGQPAGTGDTR